MSEVDAANPGTSPEAQSDGVGLENCADAAITCRTPLFSEPSASGQKAAAILRNRRSSVPNQRLREAAKMARTPGLAGPPRLASPVQNRGS